MTIGELTAKIRARELGPVEVVQAYLDRIDRLNGDLRAYISVYPELALAAAREAEPGDTRSTPAGSSSRCR